MRDVPPVERRLLAEALLVVPIARIAPLRALFTLLARIRRTPDALPADRVVWAANAVDTRLPHSTCLTRALAVSLLLALHGHPATLRLGVTRDDGQLAAHAWLERDGRAVLGEAGTFTVLR